MNISMFEDFICDLDGTNIKLLSLNYSNQNLLIILFFSPMVKV